MSAERAAATNLGGAGPEHWVPALFVFWEEIQSPVRSAPSPRTQSPELTWLWLKRNVGGQSRLLLVGGLGRVPEPTWPALQALRKVSNHVLVSERTRPKQYPDGDQTDDEEENKKAVLDTLQHGRSLPPTPSRLIINLEDRSGGRGSPSHRRVRLGRGGVRCGLGGAEGKRRRFRD